MADISLPRLPTDQAPVSIIIPLHNFHGLLSLSILSILKSTIQPAEVVIVDDGSTDDVASWYTSHLNTAMPELTLILCSTASKGAGSARQTGIAQAKQPWIAFLDSDDSWPDTYLRERFAYAQKGHQFIAGPFRYVDEKGAHIESIRLHSNRVDPWRLFISNPIANSSVFCRRELLIECGGYSRLRRRNDYATWLRMSWIHGCALAYDSKGPEVKVSRRRGSLSSAKLKNISFNYAAFKEAGLNPFASGIGSSINALEYGLRLAIRTIKQQMRIT